MTVYLWSQTAANNDDIDSTINYQEGQSPGSLNNSGRAVMAAIAKWRDDQSGMLNSGGTDTAYTVTTNQVYTALTDGIAVTMRMHATSGASPTFAPDGLTAKAITTDGTTAVPTNGLVEGSIYKFTYDAGTDKWIVIGFDNNSYRQGGTDVAVTDGGTGSSTASGARTNLGLGTIATQNANAVAVTGGSITGITDLAIADGGTGASTAAAAFTALKQDASDTATGVLEIAVQSEMEAATDVTRAVTPGRMKYHPGVAKSHILFNSGSVSITASHNVSSLTDHGTGRYSVNFTTAFSNAYYPFAGSAAEDYVNLWAIVRDEDYTKTTSVCPIAILYQVAADRQYNDNTETSVIFFGDQ